MPFAAPDTKHSSSTESVNTQRNSINNIPETPNLLQKDINSKESIRGISESETGQKMKFPIEDFFMENLDGKLHFLCSEIFNDSLSEKMKIESLKTE